MPVDREILLLKRMQLRNVLFDIFGNKPCANVVHFKTLSTIPDLQPLPQLAQPLPQLGTVHFVWVREVWWDLIVISRDI